IDKPGAYSQVQVRPQTLFAGLIVTGVGWVLLGLSMWAVLRGVLPDPPPLTAERLANYTATMGLAYVVGFLALVVPSGVGVREYFLLHLLAADGPIEFIALAVLILRLVWTAAELVVVAVLLVLPKGVWRQPSDA